MPGITCQTGLLSKVCQRWLCFKDAISSVRQSERDSESERERERQSKITDSWSAKGSSSSSHLNWSPNSSSHVNDAEPESLIWLITLDRATFFRLLGESEIVTFPGIYR